MIVQEAFKMVSPSGDVVTRSMLWCLAGKACFEKLTYDQLPARSCYNPTYSMHKPSNSSRASYGAKSKQSSEKRQKTYCPARIGSLPQLLLPQWVGLCRDYTESGILRVPVNKNHLLPQNTYQKCWCPCPRRPNCQGSRRLREKPSKCGSTYLYSIYVSPN